MPPPQQEETEINPYELLDIKTEATEQEIKSAYRSRSLKVHPDRNRNDPDAARRFHELTQASELLLDPLRRMALDAKLRLAQAKKERFKNYDAKRKQLVEELEQRERAFKRARKEEDERGKERAREEERIKGEGKRLREERLREAREKEEREKREREEREREREEEDAPPPAGDLDTTVRLKYHLSQHPALTTPTALAALLAPFGAMDVESILLSSPPPPKPGKKPKKTTAVVPFRQLGHAFAAVCASGRAEQGLEGVEVGWAEGKEPAVVGWLKARGALGAGSAQQAKKKGSDVADSGNGNVKAGLPQESHGTEGGDGKSSFSSFPTSFPTSAAGSMPQVSSASGIDYESLTLMRLRQAERERLEREILEAEAQE